MFTLTIIFITFYFTSLIKGNIFYNYNIKYHEELIELYKSGKTKEQINNEINKSPLYLGILLTLFVIVEIIYYIKAISILTIPSIILLFYMIIISVISCGKIKTHDVSLLTTEEGRSEYRKRVYENSSKRTIKGTIISIVKLGYFSYMFYLFVFVL